jgi:hypothetical protein
MSTLGVAISSVSRNRERALYLARMLRSYGSKVVLILQDSSEDEDIVVDSISIASRRETGLSKSRNLGIEMLSTDYVWFLDDDVIVSQKMYENVRRELDAKNSDVLIGQIQCSDCAGTYKNYEKRSFSKKSRALQVSSIEIVAKKLFVTKHGIKFDIKLGLGADYPSGEENCFLLDCISCDAEIHYSDRSFVSHPCADSSRNILEAWTRSGMPYSKGIIARRVGGVLGLVVLVKWILRAVFSGVPMVQASEAFAGYRGERDV